MFIFAQEGLPYLAASLVLSLILFIINPWLIIPGLVVLAFFGWFFRNPRRDGPTDGQVFFSPADGRIMDICEVDDSFIGEPARKIVIFLSVFNVHINRSPMKAQVIQTIYRPGKFLPAFKSHASLINEQNSVCFQADCCRFVVNQITGFLARRIVCDVHTGDIVEQRARFGMIKFGSCTELIVPASASIAVTTGQKVKGGITIMAKLEKQKQEPTK